MADATSDTHPPYARKRESPRIVIDKRVEWNGHAGLTRDISGGGLFVRTPEPPPVGAQLTLRLALRDGAPPLPVSATVLRTQRAPDVGAALCFCDDQPVARAEIGSFLLSLLAYDELFVGDTTEIIPEGEARLIQWQQALDRRQAQINEAVAAMARVRDAQRARKKADQERAEALDRREQLLRSVDEKLKRERVALTNEWHQRQAELDTRSAKLVTLAQSLKDERRGLGEREDGLDDRALELDAMARQLEETQRQLQVHAFERNLLTQQLRQARRERDTLEKRLELAENHEDPPQRDEHTQLFVMPQDNTPADRRPSVHNLPTAVHPLTTRARWMRVQANMRSARRWLRGLFTQPGE